MKKKIVLKAIYGVISAALLTGMIVLDNLYLTFETSIVANLCPPKVDQSASNVSTSAGKELAEKMELEGTVMVKNNNVLPLSKSLEQINVLGFGAYQWIFGGSGSGQVQPQEDNGKDSKQITILDALSEYGVNYNQDIINYYSSYAGKNTNIGSLGFNFDTNPWAFGLKDPDLNTDTKYKNLLEASKGFSNTALVVLSRQGGESEDMPSTQIKVKPSNVEDKSRHQLQISTEEEALLKYAGANYENTIVIINSTNTFQLDFLDNIVGLDGCLIVGATGNEGARAIPKILFGEASPSGRLADTQPYDFTKNIAYNYCGYDGVSFYNELDIPYGVNQKTNAGVTIRPSLPYVDYVEGIYVGYRWYETAYQEGAFKNEKRKVLDQNDNEIEVSNYDAVVQYPFGYGLSYSSFAYEVVSITSNTEKEIKENTEIEIKVKVTNTGSVEAKDVVELYMTPQYNVGEVEKSYVNLVDFVKTENIKPNENEVVSLKVKARDFASYDCYDLNKNGKKTYEIDQGLYQLKLMKNSHEVIKADIINTREKDVDAIFEYNAKADIILDKDPVTNKEIKNLFTGKDAIDGVSIDGLNEEGGNQNINYISRKDFSTITYPMSKTSTHDVSTGRKMSQAIKDRVLFAGSDRSDRTKANNWDNATVDEFGNEIKIDDVIFGATKQDSLQIAKNKVPTELGLKLGKDYSDPDWDKVLNQVTLDEAKNMINQAHANIRGIDSIGYPGQFDQDGPIQIGGFGSRTIRGVGYPDSTVLAQTWNKTLAYEFGLSYGADMVSHGVDGTYGVAINIHRNPFGGRNYEYYSEDPKLTGYLASEAVKGITNMGRNTFVKHFAVAQTETSRDSLYTWLSEQAFREIYLEGFRIVVEEGQTTALMTSYNRVGALWAGGSTALLTGVLRNEWGFNGTIITDYSDFNQFMNLDETLRAGGDLGMAVGLSFNINSTNRIKQRAKDAVKHTVYAWLNSKYRAEEYKKNPYKGKEVISANTTESFNWVRPLFIDVNIALGATILGLILFGVLDITSLFRKEKENEKIQ